MLRFAGLRPVALADLQSLALLLGRFGELQLDLQDAVLERGLRLVRVDAKSGKLSEIQTLSTLPEGMSVQPGYSTAEVQVHPSGRFLYGSNRGHDSITVFAIDPASGKLTYVQNEPTQGKTPRGFGIDPAGKFLLAGNQDSLTITVFAIDEASGKLKPTGQKIEVGTPVCVKFVVP